MAKILLERFTNRQGISWVRAHGYGVEGFAFCSSGIHPDIEDISESMGQITCPDCIAVIETCKAVEDKDLAPEYKNEMFHRRFERNR